MVDTPTGDPTPAAPSNEVTPPATPPAPTAPVNPVDPTEVEALRKKAEQAEIRARQLENEKEARDKAETERKAKELEEQNQYKTLYETAEAKAKELETKISADAKQAELNAETTKLLANYSPEVQKLVTTTGLVLTDSDEATVAAFTAKLDAIKETVTGTTPSVGSNNPSTPTPPGPSFANPATGVVEGEVTGTKFDEMAKTMPGIASMMGPQQPPK